VLAAQAAFQVARPVFLFVLVAPPAAVADLMQRRVVNGSIVVAVVLVPGCVGVLPRGVHVRQVGGGDHVAADDQLAVRHADAGLHVALPIL
jgi:hypothetical protein